MRQASLIGHVIEVYGLFVRNSARPADGYIRIFFHDRKYLGSKDRKFIADAYFGTIKNYRRLEAIVHDVTAGSDASPALAVAAYFIAEQKLTADEFDQVLLELRVEKPRENQLEILRMMADRAIEAARLLETNPVERLAIEYSFPSWFVKRLGDEYGEDAVDKILAAFNTEAPIVLRANTLVVQDREELAAELSHEGFETTPSALAKDALLLPRRMNVMGTKAFKRGAFEVQDEASQLVAPLAFEGKTSIKVLDACAGAGGKTLHLAAILQNRGEIYSTDLDPYKLEELKKRVRRSMAQNVRVFMPERREAELAKKREWFDAVLLDVPCTGTGTVRRNPGIKWVLSESMLRELVQKQREIIEESIQYVKPGGILLYATCSVLKEEGEAQLEWLKQAHPGVFEIESTIRTGPDIEGCDAFFAARLRKSG